MNDKIDSLIAQLKTEIENYVQAEVAAQTGVSNQLENPAPVLGQENLALEPSAFTMPDFSAPANEISTNQGSIGGKPMGESGIEATPIEVAVPPMPTPTTLDNSSSISTPDFANSFDSSMINNPQENQNQELFTRSSNPVVNPDPNLSIPAPDFSLPISDVSNQPTNFNSNPPAPSSTSDFQMPSFVSSETTNNSVAADAFNAPVTDLPLPGSENSLVNNVSVDEALSDLPNLNAFSNNQNDQAGQDNQTVSTPASPFYDVSDVTPKGFVDAVAAPENETSDLPQPNLPTSDTQTSTSESGFSKAKGLLSRVLQKEWGKK